MAIHLCAFLTLIAIIDSCFKPRVEDKRVICNKVLYDSVIVIKIKSYIGQPIDSLLADPIMEGFDRLNINDEPVGCLFNIRLSFLCKNNCYVSIGVYPDLRNLRYTPECNPDSTRFKWNIPLIRKEIIKDINISILE